jgi:hypothetical protein
MPELHHRAFYIINNMIAASKVRSSTVAWLAAKRNPQDVRVGVGQAVCGEGDLDDHGSSDVDIQRYERAIVGATGRYHVRALSVTFVNIVMLIEPQGVGGPRPC